MKTAPTYRVSHVERFRQWLEEEDSTMDDLMAYIAGRSEPSQAMLAGTALHEIMERAQPGDVLRDVTHGGFRFVFAPDLGHLALPATRELRATKLYADAGVRITGRCDILDGVIVGDHKTTAHLDPERYIAGYQWRLYLDIFGADVFRWHVFETRATGQMEYEVVDLHVITQNRYPALEADCAAMVSRLAEVVDADALADIRARGAA